MLLFFLLTAGAILLDQITKLLALRYLAPMDTFPLWKDVLHLTYVENTGAAFGMLKDQRWVFLVISTVALGGMIAYIALTKAKHPLEITSVAFIVGGGIGNMIDRISRGFVVDFVDVRCIPFWKYVFNVADIFVCVGCGLFILYVLLYETRAKKAEDAA
jgi:signal peptidase II